jgi:hypothetical protein
VSRFTLGPVIGTRVKASPGLPVAPPVSPVTGKVDQLAEFIHCTSDDVAVFAPAPIDPAVPTEPLVAIHVFAVPGTADGTASTIPPAAPADWFFSSGAPTGVWTPAAAEPTLVPPLAPGQVAVSVAGVGVGRSDWQSVFEYGV